LAIEYWDLKFIWNLVLGICIFFNHDPVLAYGCQRTSFRRLERDTRRHGMILALLNGSSYFAKLSGGTQ
jgi:hypothetical protein